MILDFSKSPLNIPIPNNQWEKKIIDFLNDWTNNDLDYIMTSTSGSTGLPKNILIPKSAMIAHAKLTGEFLNLQRGQSALLCLPIDFIAGKMMLVRAWTLGLKLIAIEPKSEIKLSQYIDFAAMTPMQVANSLGVIPKIKQLIIGGSPLDELLKIKLKNYQTKIYETYGMTETISHIAMKELSSNCFQVFPSIKISVDERNCLVIKLPFFNESIKTNDIVKIHSPDRFEWIGRNDNIINSGGIKLSPEKIEKELKPLMHHVDFFINSIPDDSLGEKLILIIESNDEINHLAQKISHLETLNKYEIPKEIYYLNSFIRTETGKIHRTKTKNLIL